MDRTIETNRIIQGDALTELKKLPDGFVDCCVTSPPYWGLRDYKVDGQMGLEKTPDEYVAGMVEVFSQVRRVLRDEGTLWVNIGDSYAGGGKGGGSVGSKQRTNEGSLILPSKVPNGLKAKDLIGIPWALAFALRRDGWYLRSDIIWAKKNCMPESVTDRPTCAHEHIFLLSKSSKYYYDHEAIKEAAIYDVDGTGTAARKARQDPNAKSSPDGIRAGIRAAGFKDAALMNGKHSDKQAGHGRRHDGFNCRWDEAEKSGQTTGMRNKRNVWHVATAQFPEAHFAVFPQQLISPCILAGCPPGGIVLDPFFGSGTTGLTAVNNGRKYLGIELNPDYVQIAHDRLKKELGMFK